MQRTDLHRFLVSNALVLVGCAAVSPTPNPPAEAAAAAPAPTPSSPEAMRPTARACEKRGTPERLAIRRGVSRRSSDGLEVRFAGTSHHHHDGNSEVLLDLSFRDGAETTSWLPSAGDDRWHALIHRCLRIVEAADDQVTIDVAPDSAATAPPAASSARFAPCIAANTPALTDLSGATDGERYQLDMSHEGERGWHPDPFPSMPLHHASRFEWTNLADFPALAERQTQGQSLRFTFTIRRHTIEKERSPGREGRRS